MTSSDQPQNVRFPAGSTFPAFALPKVGGASLPIGGPRNNWSLIVVYRGRHCPRCKKYLNAFEKIWHDWEAAGFDVACISADPLEKADADVAEFGWTFDVGYGLQETEMQRMGLYISEPLSPSETDRRFAEPAVYCLTPKGKAQIIAISNGPAARPDLAELLDGMIFNVKNNRPPRGTV